MLSASNLGQGLGARRIMALDKKCITKIKRMQITLSYHDFLNLVCVKCGLEIDEDILKSVQRGNEKLKEEKKYE